MRIHPNLPHVDVTGIRGDYLAFRVDMGGICGQFDLADWIYYAEVWEITRAISDINPAGGIILTNRMHDMKVELEQTPEPTIILSLTASQTFALLPDVEYHWNLRWCHPKTVESIITIAHGPLRVTQ